MLWGLLAGGLALRVVLGFAFSGEPYDQDSFAAVRDALAESPLDLYAAVSWFRWPFPPGYLPWIAVSGGVSDLTGLAFHGLVNVPAMAADAGIAWIVQRHLGRRGMNELTRLAAAGLVMLGPVFLIVSGYHGQIDSVAILPAVAAVALWERGGSRRGLAAGALIGVGIAIKLVPGLMLLALLGSVRSRREAAALLGAAAAVPLLVLAPYLAHDADAVARALVEFPPRGTAGGIGLLASLVPNAITGAVLDNANLWNALWVAAVAAVIWRTRPSPTRAAVLVWLAVYAFATGFELQYLVWGLSFLLLDGALVLAAGVQALAFVPFVVSYGDLFGNKLAARAFELGMLALWLAFLLLLAHRLREALGTQRALGTPRASPPAADAAGAVP